MILLGEAETTNGKNIARINNMVNSFMFFSNGIQPKNSFVLCKSLPCNYGTWKFLKSCIRNINENMVGEILEKEMVSSGINGICGFVILDIALARRRHTLFATIPHDPP